MVRSLSGGSYRGKGGAGGRFDSIAIGTYGGAGKIPLIETMENRRSSLIGKASVCLTED